MDRIGHMTTVVMLVAGSNQVRLLAAPAELLGSGGVDIIWLAADHRRDHSDNVEIELGRQGLPFLRFPFARVNRNRFLPGHRHLRSPASSRRLRYLLNHLRADVVVVANDTRPAPAGLLRAAELGAIPSLLVQDGVRPVRTGEVPIPPLQRVFTPDRRPYGTGRATALALMSDTLAESSVAAGVTPERIHMTGYPLYDHLARAQHGGGDHGKEHSKKRVLYVDQVIPIPTERRIAYHEALASHVAQAEMGLTIKLHPRERHEGEIASHFADTPGVTVLGARTDRDVFEDVALVLTRYSTMVFEAIFRQIPVATFDLPDLDLHLPLRPEVPSLRSIDEVVPLLRAASAGSPSHLELARRQQDVLSRETHSTDGRATERVAELILDMAEAHRNGRA